jgi:hypothetical protein
VAEKVVAQVLETVQQQVTEAVQEQGVRAEKLQEKVQEIVMGEGCRGRSEKGRGSSAASRKRTVGKKDVL